MPGHLAMGITENSKFNESGILMKENQAPFHAFTSLRIKGRLANDFFILVTQEMFYHYEKDYFNQDI